MRLRYSSGITDNVLAAGIVIVVANRLAALHGWLVVKDKPWSRRVLAALGLPG